MALSIMRANYEQMVKAQQAQPGQLDARVSDDAKFQVVIPLTYLQPPLIIARIILLIFLEYQFQAIMDQLFLSFSNASFANFAELSASVFSWLEEQCKPQVILCCDFILSVGHDIASFVIC